VRRLGAAFRTRVTRLRLLKRGWGQFTAETVTLVDLDVDESERSGVRVIDLTEIVELDEEDAETGLPYGRERLN
jgi:hypothetical protein